MGRHFILSEGKKNLLGKSVAKFKKKRLLYIFTRHKNIHSTLQMCDLRMIMFSYMCVLYRFVYKASTVNGPGILHGVSSSVL